MHTQSLIHTHTHINALSLPHTLKLILSAIHKHTHKTKPLNPRQKVGMRNQDSLCTLLSGGSNNLEQKAMQTKALPPLLLLTWVAGVAAGPPLPTSRLEPVATQRLRSPPILSGSVPSDGVPLLIPTATGLRGRQGYLLGVLRCEVLHFTPRTSLRSLASFSRWENWDSDQRM